jgi:hypothetical protein
MSEQQEREAFEAWMRSYPGHQSLAREYMNETSGRYDSAYTNLMWAAWKARAARGVQVPAPGVPLDWYTRLATMALEAIEAGPNAALLMNLEGIKEHLRAAQDGKWPNWADGVQASVPVNRPATMEEAQHAAQIGACLPNGVLFDAFGRERVRYVRVTLDGSHLILHPRELEAFKANEEEPERFTYTDVYLSEEEADALPEFDGF